MSLVINTNVSSLNTQNNLAKSQSALAQATERLSSGLKINSAADNAAGYAISQRYTTQIGGLAQASTNASDAINLAQTAGSALDQVTSNLQAIRDLAAQSANGTYSDTDRATMDKEVQQRLAEVTRIANQTTFNGKKVLDGSLQSQSFQIGADVGQTVSVSLGQSVQASKLGAIAEVSTGDISGIFSSTSGGAGGSLTLAAGDLTIDTGSGAQDITGSFTSAQDLATAINAKAGAGFATVDTTTGELDFDNSTANDVTIAGNQAATVVGAATTTVAAQTAAVAPTPGTASDTTGVAAAITAGGVTLDGTTNNISIQIGSDAAVDVAAGSYNTADDLAAAINTAYQTATGGTDNLVSVDPDNAGELKFSNTATDAVTITGAGNASSLGLPATVDAATGGSAASDGTGATTGVVAALGSTGTGTVDLSSEGLSINGTTVDLTDAKSLQDVSDDINAAGVTGVSAAVSADGKGINFYSNSELNITDTGKNITANATDAGDSTNTVAADGSITAETGGSLATGTVGTVDGANDLISRIDVALSTVADFAADLGAVQNRFQSTISTLSSQSTNLQSAQSTIQDADFAAETANLSKAQVLQQAGISVLSQANSNPQQVLKLLQ